MLTPDLPLARLFLASRPPRGTVLQCAITGAHHYGFPSPDSDLDIKGIHLAPTRDVLGLSSPRDAHDALEIFEGVECDLTTHEAGKALSLLLSGNGNLLERLASPFQLVEGVEELQALARASVSKRSYHHYRGYVRGMRREHERKRRAKSALYVYRVALTGTHLLLTGEVVADIGVLAPLYGVDVDELVAFKREQGEKARLPDDLDAAHTARFDALVERLDEALARSTLPEESPNRDAVEDWLVRQRLGALAGA